MDRLDIPFNIRILTLPPKKLEGIRPVTALDIFDGQTRSFHPDGLFSPLIFGRVGDELRSQRYSYINIKIPLFHPVIYHALHDLKRLYAGIMSGHDYAIWNPEIKDFEKSTSTLGKTGMDFFLKHWREIDYGTTKSVEREHNTRLVKLWADKALTDKIVVMPAGLRDVEFDNGRISMDDINGFYRTLLSVSHVVSDAAVRNNPESLNVSRWRMQVAFNQLYQYIESMVKGKRKLLLGSWASRATNNGTRNVITAMDTSREFLRQKGEPDTNSSLLGLYQAAQAARPITLYHLKQGFLSRVFTTVDAPAKLVNKKTLRMEEVHLKPQYFDRFMTDEGLERVLAAFASEDVRDKPMELDGYYLGLIYKGPDKTYRLFQDIGEVPLDRHREDVTPITFCELLYLSIYRAINGLPCMVTRYPVTGVGSIYPSKTVIQPTIKKEVRTELDEHWQPKGEAFTCYQFPVIGSGYFDSAAVSTLKLQGLGADHDGDMSSFVLAYTDEAIKEVDQFYKSRRAYIGTDGQFIDSTNISTIELVFHNLSSNVD